MPDFPRCGVDNVGVDTNGGVGITLTDRAAGSFTGILAHPSEAASRQMLAVALTAMSTGREVACGLTSPTEGTDIQWFTLI